MGLSRRLPWLLMLLKVCMAVTLDERLKGLSGAVASDLYSAVYAYASTKIRTVSRLSPWKHLQTPSCPTNLLLR